MRTQDPAQRRQPRAKSLVTWPTGCLLASFMMRPAPPLPPLHFPRVVSSSCALCIPSFARLPAWLPALPAAAAVIARYIRALLSLFRTAALRHFHSSCASAAAVAASDTGCEYRGDMAAPAAERGITLGEIPGAGVSPSITGITSNTAGETGPGEAGATHLGGAAAATPELVAPSAAGVTPSTAGIVGPRHLGADASSSTAGNVTRHCWRHSPRSLRRHSHTPNTLHRRSRVMHLVGDSRCGGFGQLHDQPIRTNSFESCR